MSVALSTALMVNISCLVNKVAGAIRCVEVFYESLELGGVVRLSDWILSRHHGVVLADYLLFAAVFGVTAFITGRRSAIWLLKDWVNLMRSARIRIELWKLATHV